MICHCGEIQGALQADAITGSMQDLAAFDEGVGVIQGGAYAIGVGVGGVACVDVQVAPVEVALRIVCGAFLGGGRYGGGGVEFGEEAWVVYGAAGGE